MRPGNLEVHIEELVLRGFAPTDRYRIGKAVERELAKLFSERFVPYSSDKTVENAYVDAGAFQIAPGSKPETIGDRIAQAVHGGINGCLVR